MLSMLKTHILLNKAHPINMICQIFKKEFWNAYRKYTKPEQNEKGVLDKISIIKAFKLKTKMLQSIRQSENQMTTELDDEEEENIEEINLTNQLIGEVQGFILVMRWLVYEFYQFKQLK